MTPFDITVASILGLSFIYSAFRGMIKEVFALLAIVSGYLVAVKFQRDFADILGGVISNETAASLTSFALIFIATSAAVSTLGSALQKIIRSTPVSGIDRLLGGAMGLLKGIAVLVLLMYPLSFFPDFNLKVTRDSFFAPYLAEATGLVSRAVNAPEFIGRWPEISLDDVKKKLEVLKDMEKKLVDKIDSISGEPSSQNGKPLDEHTREDKTKLKEILESLDSK